MRGDEVPANTRWQGNPIARGWIHARSAAPRPPAEQPREQTEETDRGSTGHRPLPAGHRQLRLTGCRATNFELEYKVTINRLAGAADITARHPGRAEDLHPRSQPGALGDEGDGERPAPGVLPQRAGKLHITLAAALPTGAAMQIHIRYGGSPKPNHTIWGDVGFEELTNGVLVAGQPNGASSWFPCDDHPTSRPATGSGSAPRRRTAQLPTGSWSLAASRRA